MFSKLLLKEKYPIIATLFLFVGIYLISRSIPDEKIRQLIEQSGVLGPVFLIVFALITLVIAPLSGTPIMFAGFYAFGEAVVVYLTIAAFISFITNFWIARHFGREWVIRLVGEKRIHHIDRLVEKHGVLMLFLLRIFQGGIGDFVSYAAGLTNMKFSTYIIVSVLSVVPGTLLWYFIALKAAGPLAFTLASLFLIAVFSSIFILGTIVFEKRKK